MSGCLVSRYSIAWLWSEWEALETWEATLALSYVPLAAWVCSTCPLLSVHQQPKLRFVNHFSSVTISPLIIGRPGQGERALPRSPPPALPLSPTLTQQLTLECFVPWYGGNTVTCFFSHAFLSLLVSEFVSHDI